MPTFGLAPGGVCRAIPVTRDAGALLPHRFTLTCARPVAPAGHRRSVLCGTFRQVTLPGRWPAPCPVEPRPSSTRSGRRTPSRGHPADSPSPVHLAAAAGASARSHQAASAANEGRGRCRESEVRGAGAAENPQLGRGRCRESEVGAGVTAPRRRRCRTSIPSCGSSSSTCRCRAWRTRPRRSRRRGSSAT